MTTYLHAYQGLELRSVTPIDSGMVAVFFDVEKALNMAIANHAVVDYVALMDSILVVSLRGGELPMIVPISEELQMERQLYFGSKAKAVHP